MHAPIFSKPSRSALLSVRPVSRYPRLSLVSALLMSAGLLCSVSAMAEMDALVKSALEMVQKGQAAQAFEQLSAQEDKRAGDPDFDTALGIAANETTQYTRAIFALERVLSVQPDNARARAELARALFAVGDTKAARTLLNQTRAQGVPADVGRTIDQFIQAIDKVEADAQSNYKVYAEAGFGYDSNINSGPASSSVAVPVLGGLVLALNPSGIKTSAAYATLGAGLSGRMNLAPRWSLVGNAGVSTRLHGGGNSAVNSDQWDINIGPSYTVEPNEFSLVAQSGSTRVNNTTLRTQNGFIGEWNYRGDAASQLGTYIQRSRLHYPSQTARDADRTVLGTSYSQPFKGGIVAFGGIYAGTEEVRDSTVPHLGHRLWGLRGGIQKTLSDDLSLQFGVSHENRTFAGTDPIFLVVREDAQTNFSLGAAWKPAKSWRVIPLLTFTRSASNIAINDYSKTTLSVTARREF